LSRVSRWYVGIDLKADSNSRSQIAIRSTSSSVISSSVRSYSLVVRGLSCAAMSWAFSAGGAALDHAPRVDPVYRRGRERAGATDGRVEEVTSFVAGNAGGTDVFIEEGFELMVRLSWPSKNMIESSCWALMRKCEFGTR
jgi:hypothetical protein